MVQQKGLGEFRQQPKNKQQSIFNLVAEDHLEEENGPLNKRTKIQLNKNTMVPSQSLQSLLKKPSPLGLRLRKSPSLLDLIRRKLSQENSISSSYVRCNSGFEGGETEFKSIALTSDKLKASNFPISILRIGSWERESRFEGDLVAKCYYARHMLVWEVLVGGFKSKIEILWSNIVALKANCDDDVSGTLEIVLACQPNFFSETNPQPKKHTLWQPTSDFTDGQASKHRRHFLQCPVGPLKKHFENLILCDQHLNSLSQQIEIELDSPYFSTQSYVFEDRRHGFGDLQGLWDHGMASTTQSNSSSNEVRVPTVRPLDNLPVKSISSSSAMNNYSTKTKSAASKNKELVIHSRNNIPGKSAPGNSLFKNDPSLHEVAQKLLSDSQFNSNLDEQSLMKKVNSFCCLIQQNESLANDDDKENGEKQQVISRKDSYGL